MGLGRRRSQSHRRGGAGPGGPAAAEAGRGWLGLGLVTGDLAVALNTRPELGVGPSRRPRRARAAAAPALPTASGTEAAAAS